jgi:hypothetical protein
MTWEAMEIADKAVKTGAGLGNMFVHLKDGDSVEGTFRGEPRIFYQAFGDKVEYNGPGEGRSFKFKVNFITTDDKGIPVVKILQGGSMLRKAILACRAEYGMDCVYKVKRTGAGKEDTVYSVLFKRVLAPAELETVNNMPLKALSAGEAPPF